MRSHLPLLISHIAIFIRINLYNTSDKTEFTKKG